MSVVFFDLYQRLLSTLSDISVDSISAVVFPLFTVTGVVLVVVGLLVDVRLGLVQLSQHQFEGISCYNL